MKAKELIKFILTVRNEIPQKDIDEDTANAIAQATSAGFVYELCEWLRFSDYDMDAITAHIENMYDNGNHFGVVYFIFILADSVDYELPLQFVQMITNDICIPILSGAIIEDWL